MRKNLLKLLLAFPLLIALTTEAQRKCGSHEYMQEQLAKDPVFAGKHQVIENFTEEFIARRASDPRQRRTTNINIPVVVHVVGTTAVQGVTEAQIQSQLDVLNKDFQKLNPDASKIPAAFAGLAANCQITFCLAKRDPGGNATTGIQRRTVTTASFSTNDAVKRYSTGGLDAWDASKYLNLWVCNISGGVLGYAQFPGGDPATDGVVITYTGFGTTGTAQAPFNGGRTGTHEVGHWLNLYHIWGDDGTGCTGSDQVGDTPNQAGENYGCPSYPLTDRCTRKAPGVMFMNYMDYTDDVCMYMFTAGQKARMDALFAAGGARASLLTSTACEAPAPAACGTPSGVTVSGITQNSATISWAAVEGANSYTLEYKPASSASFTTITGLTSLSYNLSGLAAGTSYTYKVSATCTAGIGYYSTPQSFTTSAPACTDITYEPNNSISAAKLISFSSNVFAQISSSSDVDYYKITTVAGQTNIKIALSNLPADYDLKLYNSAGTLLKSSQNAGGTAESIVYNTSAAGTYYIHVYGYNRVYNASVCYILNAQAGATAFRETEEQRTFKDIVRLYPVPAAGKVSIDLKSEDKGTAELIVTNQLGAVVIKKQMPVDEGVNYNSFDVSKLSNGLYFIKVYNGKTISTLKLHVQH